MERFSPKFKVGSIVYYVSDTMIQRGRIFKTIIEEDIGGNITVKYAVHGGPIDEARLYRTSRELLKELEAKAKKGWWDRTLSKRVFDLSLTSW